MLDIAPMIGRIFATSTLVSTAPRSPRGTLDPYEVKDDWFEILLPSLQLVVSKAMPAEFRVRAEFTLKKFRLTDGADVIEQRQHWLDMYEQKKLDLAGLHDMAPLRPRRCQA